MTKTILIPNGILTLNNDSFECPICSKENDVFEPVDLYEKLYKSTSESGCATTKCQGCKRKLQYCTDMRGDIVVWEYKTKAQLRKEQTQ